MTKTTDNETAALEAKAAAGDRMAIRELAWRKMSDFAQRRLRGDLVPDHNGYLPQKEGDDS